MFRSFIPRIKYGISLTLESALFTVKNPDISILYVVGLILALIPAGSILALTTLLAATPFGTDTVSLIGYTLASITYLFTLFYVRGTVIHITGGRMIGKRITLLDGIKDIVFQPFVFFKWAVITSLVKTLFKLARNTDNRKSIGTIAAVILQIILSGLQLIWQAATYFILPTIIFYSSNRTTDQALQSISVLRKRYLEIASVKLTSTVLFFLTAVFGVIVSIGLVSLSAITQSIGFISLTIGIIIFLFATIYLFITYLNDVTRTALYLESEAPEKVTEFNTDLFGATIPSEEQIKNDYINSVIESKIGDWEPNGEFKHKL